MYKGKLISFEGGEGAGKTTMIQHITAYLDKHNIDYLTTREPGGVAISEKIREVILDKSHIEMDCKTEALLFAAARRQHLVQKVIPALEKGKIVVMDRYVDSSLVYQGYVRGLGVEEVYKVNQYAIGDLLPEVTLYFDVSPEVGLKRINIDKGREVNRLDLEKTDFHEKVREGFLYLAEKFDRIEVVNAEQSQDKVLEDVLKILRDRGICNE